MGLVAGARLSQIVAISLRLAQEPLSAFAAGKVHGGIGCREVEGMALAVAIVCDLWRGVAVLMCSLQPAQHKTQGSKCEVGVLRPPHMPLLFLFCDPFSETEPLLCTAVQ